MQEQFEQLWSAVCCGDSPAEVLCDWLQEYVTRPVTLKAAYTYTWAEPDPYSISLRVSRMLSGMWAFKVASAYWEVGQFQYSRRISCLAKAIARVLQDIDSRYQQQQRAFRLT